MKDVLSFNLQMFAGVYIGGNTSDSYTTLQEAFAHLDSVGSNTATITFTSDLNAGDNLSIGKDKTYTFNLENYTLSGTVGIDSGTLVVDDTTYNGVYDVNFAAHTLTFKDFDDKGNDTIKRQSGSTAFTGAFATGITAGSYTLSGLTGSTSTDIWANSGAVTNGTATWLTNITSGAALADSNFTINFQTASTTNLFNLTGIAKTDDIDVSNTSVTLFADNLNKENVSLNNLTSTVYSLQLGADVTGTSYTSAAWYLNGTTATYLTDATNTGYALEGTTQIIYSPAAGGETATALTGIGNTGGLTISLADSSVTVALSALTETDVTASNNFTLIPGTDVLSPVASDAGFSALEGTTADYLSSGTTAGYALNADSTTLAYTAAVDQSTLFTLNGLISTSGITVADTLITLTNTALADADVYLSVGSNTYTFATTGFTAPESSTAYFTDLSENGDTSYISSGTTAGHTLSDTQNYLTYTAAVATETLFSISTLTTKDGLELDASNTVTLYAANLEGNTSSVQLTDYKGDGYKLALGSDVQVVESTSAQFSSFTSGTATYVSASYTAGYTLDSSTQVSINYSAAVASETMFTLTGIASTATSAINVGDNVITLSETALNKADVYLTNGDSQTYTLKLASGIASSTYVDAAFGAIDSTSNTATYYSGYNTGGYNVSESGLAITYTESETAVELFTLEGIAATEGIEVDASNTVTLISTNLNESDVALTNASSSATYTLALNETVSAPVTYAEGLYSDTASTAAWQTEHNTAGYTLSTTSLITYTSEVSAVDLIGVSDIATFSTSLIDFGSATLAVNSADDVLTIKNTSNSDVSVTQFGDDLTMANSETIVANQYWAYQESASGTLHYGSTVNLTNVSGITADTTGITLSGGVLVLPTGVTVESGTGKSQVTGSGTVTSVKAGTVTYEVDTNGYLGAGDVNDIVKGILFDGEKVTLTNNEGAVIDTSDTDDYVTKSDKVLTLKSTVQASDVTVTASGADVFVTNGTYTISLKDADTVDGLGSVMGSAESWKYASNTLANGGSGGVTLSSITLSAVTDTNITFSGSNANIEGAGVSYKGVTTSDGTIVAAAEGVVTLNNANVSLASSNVVLEDSTTDTINGNTFAAGSGVTATMGSSALTVEGIFTDTNISLAVDAGSIAINNSDATDVTLNNSAVVYSENSDVALSLATGAVVTINGVDGGLSATSTKITPVSDGIVFTPGTSGTVALGENTTFTGGKASINSSEEITLFSDASVTSSASSQAFTVDKSVTTSPAVINGKSMLVTGGSDVYVTSTDNGFTVGDESLAVTGDSTYTVTAATGDIQSVQGISAGATVVPNAGAIDIITDNEGAFTIGENTVTISGDTLVAFGASDSILTSVSSLDGAIAGSFENEITVDGGAVQILGDNEVTVTGADTVLSAISGVGADSVTVASAGGATTLTTDANGTYQFGSAHVFGVDDADETVNFLLSSDSDVSVTGVDGFDNGTLVLNQDEKEFFVNGMAITVSGGLSSDASVTLTTANGAVTSVEGLFGAINGLTGNATISAIDSDVTVNGAAIQINEVDSTAFEVQVESDTVTAVTGINTGATISTAKSVSVVTAEQGTFTFPNGIFNVSDNDGVVAFVTDANSNVVDIQGFAGTLTSNQNNVTVNGAAIYSNNTDASLVSSGSGVGTISGLKDNDSVTAPDGTQVIMPAESDLTVNNRKYTLTGDENGISISGSTQPTVGGLDSGAVLEVANGGTYVVNNTTLQAVNGSKIIGDPEGTAHIYEDSDIYFESDTEVTAIIEAVTGISETDTKQTNVSTDSTLGQSLNEGDNSNADGNLKVTLTNTDTDTETAQTVNFASNTGVKNATLESGNQNLTFNNEGGNVAVVGSSATGEKTITLGNGGDLVVVEGETGASVSVKAGTGNDTIVTAGNNVTADLSAGGATRVMATAGNVTLGNYNATTGSGIQVTNSDIYQSVKNNIVGLGDGVVSVKDAVVTTDVNASPEGSSVVNFFDLKGNKYQVGYTHSGGGEVDLSQSKAGVILKGNYAGGSSSNVLRGGNGDDSVLAGVNDVVDAGAGVNQIDINSDTAGVTTIRQTAESGRTTVTGFGFGFGENRDKVSISNVESAGVEYDSSSGKVTFTRGNAKLIVTGSSSSSDLASSGDLTNDGSSQQILLGEGDDVIKLEVAEKNAIISVSDNSDNRATAYRGSNSGLNFSNVTDNVSILLSSYVQGVFNTTVNSVGVDSVNIDGFNKFQGGNGNNTLSGADNTNNTIVAGTGNTTLYGGAGTGADSLVGAVSSLKSGSSTFVFINNSSKDTISNFEFLASDRDNATSADRVNFMGSPVFNAEISDNNVVVELGSIEDRLTIENGRGQNIQISLGENNYIAKVDTTSLTYDGTANLLMATGKNATVNVSSDVTSGATILLGENIGDIRSDAIFYGNIKELNASSMDGRAILGGNMNDNVIRAAQGDSTLWGGSSTESNDSLIGGNGHDVFWYGKGQGNDRVIAADSNDIVNLYDWTIDDVAAYDITSTAIALTDKNGGTLTVENAATSGVNFRLSDGTTLAYDNTEQEWDIK